MALSAGIIVGILIVWLLHRIDLATQRNRVMDEARDEVNRRISTMLNKGWRIFPIGDNDFGWVYDNKAPVNKTKRRKK